MKEREKLDIMAYPFNPSIWESEAGRSLSSELSLSTSGVPEHPGLHSNTVLQRRRRRTMTRKRRMRTRRRRKKKAVAVGTWEGKELPRALLAENKILLQIMLQSCSCTEIITDNQLEEGKIYCLMH